MRMDTRPPEIQKSHYLSVLQVYLESLGALDVDRTRDLSLTKGVLYH